jgi:hypothetical protein
LLSKPREFRLQQSASVGKFCDSVA